MRKLLLCLCFVASMCASAQDDILCASPDKTDAEMQQLPWYGNNAYLEQFYDSLSATFNGNPAYPVEGTNENVFYCIPVKFWVQK